MKSRWNFVKTKKTTSGNNIYTLLIAIMAFTSFISSKFQTLFLPYKLSYYAWATCDRARDQITHFPCPVLVTSFTKWVWSSVAVKYRLRPVYRLRHSPSSETRSVHCKLKIPVSTRTCACHLYSTVDRRLIHPLLRPFEHILTQSSPALSSKTYSSPRLDSFWPASHPRARPS